MLQAETTNSGRKKEERVIGKREKVSRRQKVVKVESRMNR